MPETPAWPECQKVGPPRNASNARLAGFSELPARLTIALLTAHRQSLSQIRTAERPNPAQRNAPLGVRVCEGEVTVTDPRHPLFGREFKLAGLACVPGHVRHCRVQIMPGIYGLIPVASTDLCATPRPEPTVLTLPALEEMVACVLALPVARRKCHATNRQSKRVGSSGQRPARRGRRRGPLHSHGGDGK